MPRKARLHAIARTEADYEALVARRFPLPLVLLLTSTALTCALFIVLVVYMGTTRKHLKTMNDDFTRSSDVTERLMLWDVELTDLAISISSTSDPQLIANYQREIQKWDELKEELTASVEKIPAAKEPVASLKRSVSAMIDLETRAMARQVNVMDDEAYHDLKADYAAAIARIWHINSRAVADIGRYRDAMLTRILWLTGAGLVLVPLLSLVIMRLFQRYRDALFQILTSLRQERSAVLAANNELEEAYDKTLEGWVAALDLRDKETEGHSLRVTAMAVQLAREMGFSGQDLENVRRGALLHDIGKLGVPDSILLKPGRLDPDERRLIEQHPVYAYEWLKGIDYLKPAIAIPYSHHERWDGKGYPQGLKGEEIPLPARIFAVIDVWDALRSDRPYRAAWPEDQIMQYLLDEAGSHFCPTVVEVFIRYLKSETAEREEQGTMSLAKSRIDP